MMKIILPALFSLTTLVAEAQLPKSIDANAFVMECVKNSGDLPHKEMVIWIPADFWRIIGDQMKMPPDMENDIVAEMDQYMMFCVVDYSLVNQQMSFRTADEIRPSLKLIDSAKVIYLPLAEKDISPRATQMMSRIQPTLSRIFGQFGEGMQIFLFDGKNANGTLSFDEKR